MNSKMRKGKCLHKFMRNYNLIPKGYKYISRVVLLKSNVAVLNYLKYCRNLEDLCFCKKKNQIDYNINTLGRIKKIKRLCASGLSELITKNQNIKKICLSYMKKCKRFCWNNQEPIYNKLKCFNKLETFSLLIQRPYTKEKIIKFAQRNKLYFERNVLNIFRLECDLDYIQRDIFGVVYEIICFLHLIKKIANKIELLIKEYSPKNYKNLLILHLLMGNDLSEIPELNTAKQTADFLRAKPERFINDSYFLNVLKKYVSINEPETLIDSQILEKITKLWVQGNKDNEYGIPHLFEFYFLKLINRNINLKYLGMPAKYLNNQVDAFKLINLHIISKEIFKSAPLTFKNVKNFQFNGHIAHDALFILENLVNLDLRAYNSKKPLTFFDKYEIFMSFTGKFFKTCSIFCRTIDFDFSRNYYKFYDIPDFKLLYLFREEKDPEDSQSNQVYIGEEDEEEETGYEVEKNLEDFDHKKTLFLFTEKPTKVAYKPAKLEFNMIYKVSKNGVEKREYINQDAELVTVIPGRMLEKTERILKIPWRFTYDWSISKRLNIFKYLYKENKPEFTSEDRYEENQKRICRNLLRESDFY